MFERKHEKLAPAHVFIRRLAACAAIAGLLAAFALLTGVVGYHTLAGLGWVDSLLNASMILGGMGPVDVLTNTGAKVFASGYALFSGLVFIAVIGIIFAPIAHRMLHKFHLDEGDLRGWTEGRVSQRHCPMSNAASRDSYGRNADRDGLRGKASPEGVN
jgi:hypothetical protein